MQSTYSLSLVGSNVELIPLDEDLISDAFRIGKENKLTSYDSTYVALARRLDGSLASRDPKQLEVAREYGLKILDT
jgi:predicted nucleic acid-binding protein